MSEKNIVNWFTNARFGMFVHWGLYSIPAGIWKGKPMGRNWYAEWMQPQGDWPHGCDPEEYRDLAKEFNPLDFNAGEWIETAKKAGMKYFLITSKHHDGFALWDSKVSDFNIVKATPYGKDVLKELMEACHKHGIHVGYYYSHWQDWEHKDGANPPWPSQPGERVVEQPSSENFQRYWEEKCLPQVAELARDYGAEFFWFDNWEKADLLTPERLESLIKTVKDINPDCLINSRIGTTWNHPEGDTLVDYLSMGDNKFPQYLIDTPWETSATFNRSWGYNVLDHKWRSTEEILKCLVDNVSRNGNFQLNIGPMGNGKIPAPSLRRLKETGAWLEINGEAVYDTRPFYGNEPEWGRITTKKTGDGNTFLYLHLYDMSQKGLVIKEVYQDCLEAVVLETGEVLPVQTRGESTYVFLPEFLPDERISVIRLKVKGNLTACFRKRVTAVNDSDSNSVG
jgi:alpha-L-fucosidase